MAIQCLVRVVPALAGNLLRPRFGYARSLSRRRIYSDCTHVCLHRRHHRRQGPRARHLLRLFRPCQQVPQLRRASRPRFSTLRRASPVMETSLARQLTIRGADERDHDRIWQIFQATIAPGDAFVYDPNTSREEAMAYWFANGTRTYVAEQDGQVAGSYILRPNRPGLGNHVANAGFMVDPAMRGRGVGRAMGEHALSEARRLGYRDMQFNFVISTNE